MYKQNQKPVDELERQMRMPQIDDERVKKIVSHGQKATVYTIQQNWVAAAEQEPLDEKTRLANQL